MKTLKYLGPGGLLIVVGREVPRGSDFQASDGEARRLLADPNINVSVLQEHEPEARRGVGQTGEAKQAAADNDETKEATP